MFCDAPRPGEVYNLGGGRENSASVLECIDLIRQVSGHEVDFTLSDVNRVGDHICYISDLRKFREHFPQWEIRSNLESIVGRMVEMEVQKG